jgi:hypothetical protein
LPIAHQRIDVERRREKEGGEKRKEERKVGGEKR